MQRRAFREEPEWNFGGGVLHMKYPEPLEKQYLEHKVRYLEWIEEKSRYMDRGASRGTTSPPKWFLQILKRRHRAKNRNLMAHEKYDILIPNKRDAAWSWW